MPNNLANATQPMDTTNLTLVTSTPARPAASLGASADPEFCPIALAPIPPVMGTDTDAARQFYRNAVSQLRMPPLPAASKIAQGAQAATQVIYQVNGGGSNTSASSTTGVDLQVNNVDCDDVRNPADRTYWLNVCACLPQLEQVSSAPAITDVELHESAFNEQALELTCFPLLCCDNHTAQVAKWEYLSFAYAARF